MKTIVQMAHRSDRREDMPKNLWSLRLRPGIWLLARGFHFGQEKKGSLEVNLLHKQAGDTSIGLTHRLGRRTYCQLWNTNFTRGSLRAAETRPFLRKVDRKA